MKVLLLGGTGVLSGAMLEECIGKHYDTYIMNRGNKKAPHLLEDHVLIADLRNQQAVKAVLKNSEFDAVVDFLSYTPDHIRSTLSLFEGHMKQYVFISSATAYSIQDDIPITEDRELVKKGWRYACNKTICEGIVLKEASKKQFNYTIIRPYVTYGDTRIPFAVCKRHQQWSLVNRIINNKPILMWDDGKAGCPLTHTSDFARGAVSLLGNPESFGQTYHITSDEVRNWNEVVSILGNLLKRTPSIVYLPSKVIEKEFPEYDNELTGDKGRSYRFDNSKIKSIVPGFQCYVSLEKGLQQTIDFYQNTPSMRVVDIKWDACIDRVIAKYEKDKSIKKKLHYIAHDGASATEHLCYCIYRCPLTFAVMKYIVFIIRISRAILKKLQQS